MYKFTIILLVVCSTAFAHPLEAKESTEILIKREVVPEAPVEKSEAIVGEVNEDSSDIEDIAVDSEVRAPKLTDIISQTANAIKVTIKDDRDALYETVKKLFEATGQNLEVGIDAAKAGFDVFLFVPKVGKNFFNLSKNKTPASTKQ